MFSQEKKINRSVSLLVLVAIVCAITTSNHALADCQESYKSAIAENKPAEYPHDYLETAGGGLLICGVLVLSSSTGNPGSVLTAYGTAATCGTVAAAVPAITSSENSSTRTPKREDAMKALALINQAELGDGAQLRKFLHETKRSVPSIDLFQVVDSIKEMNRNNVFCSNPGSTASESVSSYDEIESLVLDDLQGK